MTTPKTTTREPFRGTIALGLYLTLSVGSLFGQAAGALDSSFDSDGISFFADPNRDSYAAAVAEQADGKIVVAGAASSPSGDQFCFVRLNTDGSPDLTFGIDGQSLVDVSTYNDRCEAVIVLSNGKILGAGYLSVNSVNADFVLVQLNADGSVDTSFGNNGITITDFNGVADIALDMVVQPDGHILLAGYERGQGFSNIAVARYTASGVLDNTFGSNGKVSIDLPGDSEQEAGTCIALQPNGKIIIGGSGQDGSSFAMVRLNANGTLDNTFSGDGIMTTVVGLPTDVHSGLDLVIVDNGSIVMGGWVGPLSNYDFGLIKVLTSGVLDTGFGNGGRVLTDFGSRDYLYGLIHQGFGYVVAAGSIGSGFPGVDFALARYTPSGDLDNTFSADGKVITDLGVGSNDLALAITLTTDLKLIVAGGSDLGGAGDDMVVARYGTGLEVGILEFSSSEMALIVFPNPIRESTTFSYSLAESERLTITLQDLQGKQVTTFLDGELLPAGEHRQVVAMPTDLASGNYLLVFSSPNGKTSIQVTK